jgi:Arc/MetJ family transcription regulator
MAPIQATAVCRRCLARLVRALNPVYKKTLILFREVDMSVRLNITMDDDVYARLKKEVPPKKLSAFIAGAVRAKLHPDAKALNAAYQAASKERWRTSLDENWKHSDAQGWPKLG